MNYWGENDTISRLCNLVLHSTVICHIYIALYTVDCFKTSSFTVLTTMHPCGFHKEINFTLKQIIHVYTFTCQYLTLAVWTGKTSMSQKVELQSHTYLLPGPFKSLQCILLSTVPGLNAHDLFTHNLTSLNVFFFLYNVLVRLQMHLVQG